ncbi:MAG: glycosyltransferase [archaeon]|nr:glycosyltransferase [archaeon]
MRIALIGPLNPFRGGIAHSNEMLLRNLSKTNEVDAISFRRLYPKILYPGKFQAEGKNNAGILDSISPLNWLGVAKKINSKKPETIIFQWWTTFLFPPYFFLSFLLKGKKAAICQNVFPHEEGLLKKITGFFHSILTKVFLSRMDVLVAMSQSDKKMLERLFPKKKVTLYLEPMYELEGISGAKFSRESAKNELGVTGRNVLLFFGFVREYKGLRYLVEAMPEIVKKSDAKLFIVGEFWEPRQKYEELIHNLGLGNNVHIVDRYVGNDEVPKFFLAADLLVLPYTAISESGVIRMAFNFNTPILSTNVGGNPDHIEDGVNGFLVEPKSASQISERTNEFFSKKLFKKMALGMQAKRKELEWSKGKEKAVLGI